MCEALRDENVKLELELAALRLGGRAEKMAIADAYEEELAMSRILWEMCGPSDGREVWAEADKRQLDAVGETLREQLDHARGAYGVLVAQLWEYNARAQALSRALTGCASSKALLKPPWIATARTCAEAAATTTTRA